MKVRVPTKNIGFCYLSIFFITSYRSLFSRPFFNASIFDAGPNFAGFKYFTGMTLMKFPLILDIIQHYLKINDAALGPAK